MRREDPRRGQSKVLSEGCSEASPQVAYTILLSSHHFINPSRGSALAFCWMQSGPVRNDTMRRGCLAWIRTMTNRSRICSATVTPRGKKCSSHPAGSAQFSAVSSESKVLKQHRKTSYRRKNNPIGFSILTELIDRSASLLAWSQISRGNVRWLPPSVRNAGYLWTELSSASPNASWARRAACSIRSSSMMTAIFISDVEII